MEVQGVSGGGAGSQRWRCRESALDVEVQEVSSVGAGSAMDALKRKDKVNCLQENSMKRKYRTEGIQTSGNLRQKESKAGGYGVGG